MLRTRTLLLFLALVLLPWSGGCTRDPAAGPPDLRILWTNDTHGYLSPLYHREEGDDRFVERARQEGRVGGFAYISTIVRRQRAEQPDRTLLLDSGDTWHGTVVPVRLGGTPVVEVMNTMGYDAMVPGNVEFFYDEKTLTRLFAAAKFPIVIANLFDAKWNERVQLKNVSPYVVRKVGRLKVAIVGMTYHWMSRVTYHPQWAYGLRVDEVQADIDRLRNEEKVDLVVLLSHMGWKVDAHYAKLVRGVDVIVGAHTHDILYRPTLVRNEESGRDVLVVQCGSHGKMVGQLDLTVRDSRVAAFEQTLFPVRTAVLEPHEEIAMMIEKLRAPYKAELERVIGETSTLLYRQGTWQSTADNLMTDALRARTGKEIAMVQPGRYGATILPGPITVEDVYNLAPTESPVYQMEFSGQQLREMLEAAVDNAVTADPLTRVGGNMWRFSGMEVVVDLTRPYPTRVRSLRIGDKPVVDRQLYSLAEYEMYFRYNPRAIELKETDRIGPHEIIAYIEQQKTVASKLDRRITDQRGNIMRDRERLDEVWAETGRAEVDVDRAKLFQYRGARDTTGHLRVTPTAHKP